MHLHHVRVYIHVYEQMISVCAYFILTVYTQCISVYVCVCMCLLLIVTLYYIYAL